jgi:RNA polymerase sigma-70 factor (ECF subfamily)
MLTARALSAHPAAQPADEAASIALAHRAANGDLAASQQLLTELAPTVARVVAGVIGARNPDFDDVVQQSLIALLRALPGFRGECHPGGFASTIAFRVALKNRKRQHVDRARREQIARFETADHNPLDLHDPSRRRHLLRDLLLRLPEEQAEALALRVILGWSLQEVAEATGARVNTVRSRVRLAKEALRRRIEARPDLRDALEVKR